VGGFWNFVVLLFKSEGIEEDRKWSGFSVNAKTLQLYNTFGCLELMRQIYVSTLKNFGFLMYLRVHSLCGVIFFENPLNHKTTVRKFKMVWEIKA
jgi:hypothetical protein